MSGSIQLRRVARMAYGDALAAESRIEGAYPVVGSGGASGTHNQRNFGAPGIVIGRKGSYGSIHWVPSGGFAIDTAYYIDNSSTSANLRWLYYALKAVDIKGASQDVGVPGLAREAAYAVSIPTPPPLEEQRRIADFLDAETARIDRMRTAVERLREVLEERRAVQRSLTLRGNNKAGQRQTHSFLRDLPADWAILPLKRLVPRIGVGVVVDPSSYFSDEGVPFLRGSNITENGIDLSGVRRLSRKDSAILWRSRLNTGDVVVVRAGYPGRAVVIPENLDGANCASLLVIKRGERLIPEYLEAYFNSPLGTAYVDSARYGAAQEQINVSHVVNFMVPVPDLGEQKEILAQLKRNERPVHELRTKLSRQARLLSERRQALITAAVTGEFDVSTASGRGIEE